MSTCTEEHQEPGYQIKQEINLLLYGIYIDFHRCPNADMNCNLHTQISNFVVSL